MTKEHLIPLGQPGNEEHDKKVRAKIKGSSSDRRKLSQRINGIKKAKPENVEKKLLALVTNPKVSALEIIKLLDDLKKSDYLKPETKIQLVNTAIKAHTAIFGNKNLNVNINNSITDSKNINEIYYEVISEQSGKSKENSRDVRKTDNKRSNKD